MTREAVRRSPGRSRWPQWGSSTVLMGHRHRARGPPAPPLPSSELPALSTSRRIPRSPWGGPAFSPRPLAPDPRPGSRAQAGRWRARPGPPRAPGAPDVRHRHRSSAAHRPPRVRLRCSMVASGTGSGRCSVRTRRRGGSAGQAAATSNGRPRRSPHSNGPRRLRSASNGERSSRNRVARRWWSGLFARPMDCAGRRAVAGAVREDRSATAIAPRAPALSRARAVARADARADARVDACPSTIEFATRAALNHAAPNSTTHVSAFAGTQPRTSRRTSLRGASSTVAPARRSGTTRTCHRMTVPGSNADQ